MTRPTDEELMAYADGALDPVTHARVEAYLATNAEARADVATFHRTAVLARKAFSTPLDEAPPKALVDAILGVNSTASGTDSKAKQPAGSVDLVDLSSRRQPHRLRESLRLPLAASLALLVGLGAGYVASRGGADHGSSRLALGVVKTSAPLADVLERRPTGSTTGSYVIVATFRDKQDRACREIEVLSATTPARPELAGAACRGGDGLWTVEGAARIAVAHRAGTQIEPSGAPEHDALSGILDILGAKPALAPIEEKRLIERGWK